MSLRKTLKRGNSKHLFVYLFIYLFISCIAAIFILNTPAEETHWTRDKVDFCCCKPLDITVSSFEWDAHLLQIPPLPKFYNTRCLRKDRYIMVSWSEPRKGVRSNASKCTLFDHDPLSFLTSVIPSKLLFTIISGLISSCS